MFAVYGLDDAPFEFRQSLIKHLRILGFVKSLLDPCWWLLRNPDGTVKWMILLDVDDLILSCPAKDRKEFHDLIAQRFQLGKYEEDQSEFCGRRIIQRGDGLIEVDMQKYILEDLQEIEVSRQRKADKKDQVTMEEFKSLRSAIFKLNWLGREARPEVSGTASIMASALPRARVEDILLINKVIRFLKRTSERTLKVWPIPVGELHLLSFSDAGGVLGRQSGEWTGEEIQEPTQGAWIIFAGQVGTHGRTKNMSPLMWRSGKLRRKVPSTLAGETLALGEAVASVEWAQVFLADILRNKVPRKDWSGCLSEYSIGIDADCRLAQGHSQLHVVDAKAVFDTLQKEAAGSRQDRRAAVDLAIIQESLLQAGARMKWVPHSKMLADPLTKLDPEKGSASLENVLDSGLFQFTDPKEELAWRAQDHGMKNRSRTFSQKRAQEDSRGCSFAVLYAGAFPQEDLKRSNGSEEAESWGHCEKYTLTSSDLDSLSGSSR